MGVLHGILAALISNICFPKGTLVATDQGTFEIQHLTKNHSMGGHRIVAITETVTMDDHLIEFRPNSLAPNVPSSTLRLSKDHAILHQNELKKAKDFSQGRRVPYTGEILYNVLLPVHGLMNVHGVACETLHPDNSVARLYRSKVSPEIVEQWNNNVVAGLKVG